MRFAVSPGTGFLCKLVPAVLVAMLGDWLFYQRGFQGAAAGVFALALLAAAFLGRSAIRRDRRAVAALLAASVYAAALVWKPGLLGWTLFWLAAGMATLLPLTTGFDDGWRWLQRLAWQALRAPFAPFVDVAHWRRARRRVGGGGLRAGVSLFALPVAGSAVIVALFAAANPVFETLVSGLLPEFSVMTIPRMAFWFVLFAMAWSLLRPRLAARLLPCVGAGTDMRLPGVSTASVTLSLAVFNAIFLAQNLLDAAYLWGLAPLPEGMTLAQYAHRGAYPLIVTALLAAAFVLVTLRPGSETARSGMVRRLVTLWTLQNIVLVVSSMLRTVDYVEAYSLTWLRIAALAWMALVGFGLAAICWRLLRGRSAAWLINVNLAAAGTVLTTACFVDLDAVAATWNVRHAREVGGRGAALDLCYLSGLGDSAMPALLELERRPGLGPVLHERVQTVRADVLRGMEYDAVHAWTVQRHLRLRHARAVLAQMPPAHIAPGARGCDGTLLPPPPPPPSITAPATLTGAAGK